MIEPELWGKSSTFLSTVHLKSLTEIKNSIKWKNNESIFEFGMGDGSNSKSVLFPILPNNYKEFIGSDISRRMVEYLKRNITDPRATFVILDMSADTIPEEFVNRQALKNMYKMLKPEGQMLLTYADETSADEVYYELSLHSKWKKYDHTKLISPFFRRKNVMEEYNKLFKEVGFREISSTVEQLASKLTDENMFYDFCISINPILSMVSNEEYEEYKQEYVHRMKNNKLNKTKMCPKTGEISCYTSAVITSVLLEKI
ncbi:unnamed protein product [Diabrotica balteata]|uniref:Juvenile hormone acid O-methyltransferase-like n=1 Tax=Diabrotica balteata TaxID=107213 RepID=A0A9N9X4X0_DIABA|nr:unnamed protein product [Diabrotica balteata]